MSKQKQTARIILLAALLLLTSSTAVGAGGGKQVAEGYNSGEYHRDNANPGTSIKFLPADTSISPSKQWSTEIPSGSGDIPPRARGAVGSRTVITPLSTALQSKEAHQTGRYRVQAARIENMPRPQPNPHPDKGRPQEVATHQGGKAPGVARVAMHHTFVSEEVEQIQAGPRHLFYYVHIPKAGGSSVNRYFWSDGRPSGITPCNQTGIHQANYCPHVGGGGPMFCQRLFRKLSSEKHVQGEYSSCNFLTHETVGFDRARRFRLRDSMLPDLKAITFLREPVSHYLSQYKGSFVGTKKGNPSITLRIKQYMEGGFGYGGGGNMMTSSLLGRTPGNTEDPVVPRARQKLLENFFMFGIVEHWAQSFCLLSFQLGQFRKDLCEGLCRAGHLRGDDSDEHQPNHVLAQNAADSVSLAADKANIPAAHPLAANLTHHWCEGLDMGVLERIRKINTADMSLYTWAVEVFKARVRHVERAEGVHLLCDEWGD